MMCRQAVNADEKAFRFRSAILSFICCFSIFCTACSPRHLVVDQMTELVHSGMAAFEGDDDLVLVERAIPANIKLLEVLLANRPENDDLPVLLARLYGSYAFAFVEGRLEAATLSPPDPEEDLSGGGREALRARADAYYRKGVDYALRVLETRYPHCREQLKNARNSADFFRGLTGRDVPALFWYAFNLAGHVNLNRDSVRVVARAHLVEKAAKRVLDLDPAYFNGGAHLLLMVYYASRPPMMGGNLAAALDHYRKLKAVAGGGFLLADCFFGRFYQVQAGDRAAFESALHAVVDAPPGPDRYRLYNAVARKRARRYLSAAGKFFE